MVLKQIPKLMRKLPFIPAYAYIRHPDGQWDGPLRQEEILERVRSGSVSKFIWIYEIEKRLGTALKDLPEYEQHPESVRSKQFFPHGYFIDGCYYMGLMSPISGICFFLPAIFAGAAGIVLGLFSFMRWKILTADMNQLQKKEALWRIVAGTGLSLIFALIALFLVIDFLT